MHPACPARSSSPGPTQVEGTFLFLEQVVALTPFLFLACDHHAQWASGLPDNPGAWAASGEAVGPLWGGGEQGLSPGSGGPDSSQIPQAWPLAESG